MPYLTYKKLITHKHFCLNLHVVTLYNLFLLTIHFGLNPFERNFISIYLSLYKADVSLECENRNDEQKCNILSAQQNKLSGTLDFFTRYKNAEKQLSLIDMFEYELVRLQVFGLNISTGVTMVHLNYMSRFTPGIVP